MGLHEDTAHVYGINGPCDFQILNQWNKRRTVREQCNLKFLYLYMSAYMVGNRAELTEDTKQHVIMMSCVDVVLRTCGNVGLKRSRPRCRVHVQRTRQTPVACRRLTIWVFAHPSRHDQQYQTFALCRHITCLLLLIIVAQHSVVATYIFG